MNTPLTLLNQLTPAQFLAEYWQKKPLLIKSAIPNFKNLLNPNELAGLACEEDVQARIVQYEKEQWQVQDGPFDEADFTKLPERDWTLLVQSVNHHLPEAAALLAQFNFIPHARLDDLMVSYAPIGGGIGAHVDSYDVFLLQGSGKRRWQISTQSNSTSPDLSLIEDAPLKILKHFEPEQEWVLEAGDMLYLPPQVAHKGIAVDDECMTYSIGFRAPKIEELQYEFLSYLQDKLQAQGLYEDTDLSQQKHPAEISNDMVNKVSTMLQGMTWDKGNVAEFLGLYLTEPKTDIIFESASKIDIADFSQKIAEQPLKLNLKSQLLSYESRFYLNGEGLAVPEQLNSNIQHLADHGFLESTSLDKDARQVLASTLHSAYMAGYIILDTGKKI